MNVRLGMWGEREKGEKERERFQMMAWTFNDVD